MKEIYSIKEISNYLQISISMTRKLVKEKKIPYFKIGNRIKFNIYEINKWVLKNQEKESLYSLFS